MPRKYVKILFIAKLEEYVVHKKIQHFDNTFVSVLALREYAGFL